MKPQVLADGEPAMIYKILDILRPVAVPGAALTILYPFSTATALRSPHQQRAWSSPPQTARYQYIGQYIEDSRGRSKLIKQEKKSGHLPSPLFVLLFGLDSDSNPLIELTRSQQGVAAFQYLGDS